MGATAEKTNASGVLFQKYFFGSGNKSGARIVLYVDASKAETNDMSSPTDPGHFETRVLIHLDAAFNLSRWLMGDDASAEDAVQDACLRAQRFFGAMTGPNPKAWFMTVVRNTCLDHLRDRKRRGVEDSYDEDVHGDETGNTFASPEGWATRDADTAWVREAIAKLPPDYREVIVLRELEEMSYKEISAIVNVPIGTVMSRLSRGRDLLAQRLRADVKKVQS
jgi:RNA polymerase sigma factor (sigma-70 family)